MLSKSLIPTEIIRIMQLVITFCPIWVDFHYYPTNWYHFSALMTWDDLVFWGIYERLIFLVNYRSVKCPPNLEMR